MAVLLCDSDSPENKESEKGRPPRKAKILKPFELVPWRYFCDAMAEAIAEEAKAGRAPPLTKAERAEAERTLNEIRQLAGLPALEARGKGDSTQWRKRAGRESAKVQPIDKRKGR